MRLVPLYVAHVAVLLGLSEVADAQLPAPRLDSLAVTTRELETHLRELSSNRYEGRYPGTRGESLTTSYLVRQLADAGVRPGAGAGWLQRVELIRQRADSTMPVAARLSGGVTRTLGYGHDLELTNNTASAEVSAGGELVFVGYGIDAPVYAWHDFAGVDLRGKVAVALPGEPTVDGDSVRFNGRRGSRFQSSRDKQLEMARRGAVGILWVAPAGRLPLAPPAGVTRLASEVRSTALRFTGTLSDSVLGDLLPAGAPPLAKLIASAARPGFRARPLGTRLDVRFRSRPTTIVTHNVVGVVPGRDPLLRDDHVVLSAHWDAYGIGPAVDGDSIYNGALDDGSGLANLLALARVFGAHPQRRSITVLFTTAEEMGLLGAQAYVCGGPLRPERMAANLNVDNGLELWGVKRDAMPISAELSTLGRTAERMAARRGLRVSPDTFPDDPHFNTDDFAFAKAGVPSLSMGLGLDAVDRPAGWVVARLIEYLEHHYHKPSDEYENVVVNLEGLKQMAEFVRDVTVAVANADERPTWHPGAEFQRTPESRGPGCGDTERG